MSPQAKCRENNQPNGLMDFSTKLVKEGLKQNE